MTQSNNYPPKDKQVFIQQDYNRSASSGDCTGLIPSAALNDEEFESYNEVYNFLTDPAEKTEIL